MVLPSRMASAAHCTHWLPTMVPVHTSHTPSSLETDPAGQAAQLAASIRPLGSGGASPSAPEMSGAPMQFLKRSPTFSLAKVVLCNASTRQRSHQLKPLFFIALLTAPYVLSLVIVSPSPKICMPLAIA